jgi:predicted RNA polymerase sigma factor
MRLGKPVEARDAYRRYLQLAPEGANAVFIRAIVDEQEP